MRNTSHAHMSIKRFQYPTLPDTDTYGKNGGREGEGDKARWDGKKEVIKKGDKEREQCLKHTLTSMSAQRHMRL